MAVEGGGACARGGSGGGAAGSDITAGGLHFQHIEPPFSRMRTQAWQPACGGAGRVIFACRASMSEQYCMNP